MGNIGDLSEEFDLNTSYRAESGIGTVTTLSMSDEEKEKADEHKNPIGFIWPSA